MLKRIVKTSFFSLGARGFMTLTTLVLTALVSRNMGAEKVTDFAITFFLYFLFGFLTSFELTTYFAKEAAHQRENRGELRKLVEEANASFGLGTLISIGIIVLLAFVYKKIDTPLLIVSSVSGIIFGYEKNLSGFLLGKEEMHIEFFAQAVSCLIVCVPAFFALKALDIIGIYYLRIAASFLAIFIRWILTGMRTVITASLFKMRFYNKKEVRYFAVTGCCYFIQYHFDLLVLPLFAADKSTAAYFVALRIFSSFCLLPEMTTFALTPYISRIYRRKESGIETDLKKFYNKIILSGVVLGAIASLILFFSRHLIMKIFTRNDEGMSSGILVYFTVLLFFRFVSYYTGTILSSTEYQKIRYGVMIGASAFMLAGGTLLGFFFTTTGMLWTRGVMEFSIFLAYFVAIEKPNLFYAVVTRRKEFSAERAN